MHLWDQIATWDVGQRNGGTTIFSFLSIHYFINYKFNQGFSHALLSLDNFLPFPCIFTFHTLVSIHRRAQKA